MTGLSLVIPAKELGGAKSRLSLPRPEREALALAMLGSTVETALSSECAALVLVVTSDPRVAEVAEAAGAGLVHESHPSGINQALWRGRHVALQQRPDAPVGLLVADLPFLCAADLDEVARQHDVARAPLVVVDHEGTGTTMLVHPAGRAPAIAFGAGSASAHVRAGYRPAVGPLTSLRHDADRSEDLAAPLESHAFDRWRTRVEEGARRRSA